MNLKPHVHSGGNCMFSPRMLQEGRRPQAKVLPTDHVDEVSQGDASGGSALTSPAQRDHALQDETVLPRATSWLL